MALSYELEPGVEVSLPVWADAFPEESEPGNPYFAPITGDLPPGLEWSTDTFTVDGTPEEEGEWPVTVFLANAHGQQTDTVPVVFTVGDPGGGDGGDDEPGEGSAVIVEGTAVTLDLRTVLGLDLPDLTGATAAPLPAGMTDGGDGTLSGTPTAPGEVTVELRDDGDELVGTVVVLILPAGSSASDDPWDVWDNLAAALAPRVAALVGRQGDPEAEALATAQLPLVAEYVRGYTRGRGFEDDAPAGPLRAVIVSATARLATNPEQVSVYTMGDYSERPAQLAGWTLAEIGVLHRYRVVTA